MDAIDNESLLLYDICCVIGISSSQRKRKIQSIDGTTTLVNLMHNLYLTNEPASTIVICGSHSEGIRPFPMISSCLRTSPDIDFMLIVDGINVQEDVDTTKTNNAEVLQLVYIDSPEHVLVEVKSAESVFHILFNTSVNSILLNAMKRKDDKLLVSSSFLKDNFQGELFEDASLSLSSSVCRSTLRHAASFETMTVHGPAVMTEGSSSTDMVFSLRCYEWPTPAHEWIDRARPHGWPSRDLIDQIMYDGCELVPVGRKDHPDEWKLSFSRAETRLVRHFNICQAQCYQLLKIVKTVHISLVVADSLSSYHIKTVMLHTVEQTDPTLWRKENLAQCFMMCLSNLKRYLADKYLPHYFIVRKNLLKPKVTGDVHQNVLKIVTVLDEKGLKCILHLLKDVCWAFQEPYDNIPLTVLTDVFALEGNRRILHADCSALLSYVLSQKDLMYHTRNLTILVGFCEKTFLKPTSIHPSVETAREVQLLQKSTLGLLLTVIRAMARPDTHGIQFEPMMNFARQCLEESCHADVSSFRLRFATVLFHLGEYDRCVATVKDVLERFKDVWIVVGGKRSVVEDGHETLRNLDASKLEFKLNQVLQLSDNGFPFISNHLSLPVFFKGWEVAVAPEGVQFMHKEMSKLNVMNVMKESCCIIDSIVYAHYLLLESYLKIDEHDLAEHTLINMKYSIRNGKDDIFDRNCLCYCEEDNLLLQYSDRLMAKNGNDT